MSLPAALVRLRALASSLCAWARFGPRVQAVAKQLRSPSSLLEPLSPVKETRVPPSPFRSTSDRDLSPFLDDVSITHSLAHSNSDRALKSVVVSAKLKHLEAQV